MNFINLAIYLITAIFSNGRWIIPLAFWIAPVFFQRFLRKQKLAVGNIAAFAACYLATCISYRGVIPVEGVFYYLITLGIAMVYWLFFLIDRLVHRGIPGFSGTLVLPICYTLIEFGFTLINPYGAWGGAGLTQIDNAVFVQVASVTGRWGITFLLLWFASTVNWLWDARFHPKENKKGIIIFCSVLVTAFVYGGIRLYVLPDETSTVRTAGICPENIEKRWGSDRFGEIYEKIGLHDNITADEKAFFNAAEDGFDRQLYELTEREARAGAKIIAWGETALFRFAEDEADFKSKYLVLAEKYQIYILCTAMIIRDETEIPFHNMAFLFTPERVIREYTKSNIVPGDRQYQGNGEFFMVVSPYGVLSSFLCFDQVSPGYVGRFKAADLLLVPHDDWREIDPYFTKFMEMYAIEYGFNVLVPAIQSRSAAYDHRGNLIAQADYFTSSPTVLVAELPVKGSTTVYEIIGDWIVWLCGMGAIVLVIIFIRRKRPARRKENTEEIS